MPSKQFNSVDGYSIGNANVVIDSNGNVSGNAITATANITAPRIISNVATGTAPFVVTSTTQVANLNVATAGTATTATTATTAGTVTTNAQPNITSVGTLTGLTANGNANINLAAGNTVTIAAAAPPTADMVTITNSGQNVATAGVNGLQVTYVGGAGAIEASAIRSDMTPGATSGSTWNAFRIAATTAAVSGVVFNGLKFDNKSTGAGTSRAFYVGTGYDEILNYNGTVVINGNGTLVGGQVVGTVPTATTAGTVTTAAQSNITSVGTLTSLAVSGTTGVVSTDSSGAASTNKIIRAVNGVLDVALIPRAGAGSYNNLTVADDAMIVFANSSAQGNANLTIAPWATATSGIRIQSVSNTATIFLNATNTNVSAALNVTGNVTAPNFIGNLANGTSDVSIPTANGNINFDIGGTSNVVVMTNTGVNVAGTLNATGNITGSNLISTAYTIASVGTGISAAGTVQSNATAIGNMFNVVSTVASGAGVRLPTAVAGMRITVLNTSANALAVYPATNGIINSAAANAAYSQPAGARLDYISTSTTQWYTLNATYG